MNATDEEILGFVVKCVDTWPQREISEVTIRVYAEALTDLSLAQLTVAYERLRVSARWFPTIAEIRECALGATKHSDEFLSEDQAWYELRRELQCVGSTRGMDDWTNGGTIEPQWSDAEIGRIADRIGWQYLCNSKDEMADRVHFNRYWAESVERRKREKVLTPKGREILASLNAKTELGEGD